MQSYKVLFLLSLIFCLEACLEDKKRVEESLTYLDENLDYPYLDEYYRIDIPSDSFQAIYNRYPMRVEDSLNLTYKDSMRFIFADKYKGLDKEFRMSCFKLFYTYERLGWNLQLTATEAQELHSKLDFLRFPYDVKKYFLDSTKHSAIKDEYLNHLRNACFEKTKDSSFYDFDVDKLLVRSFEIDRLKRLHEAQRKRGVTPHDH